MKKILRTLFMELSSSGNNGIIGHGFKSWRIYRISWGKIAVWLILVAAVIYFTF